jgi:DNA-binding HxlR family transcriptional regulator
MAGIAGRDGREERMDCMGEPRVAHDDMHDDMHDDRTDSTTRPGGDIGPHPGTTPRQIEAAVRVLGERWKPTLLWWLTRAGRPLRFTDLQRLLPGTAHKVLVEQLADLVRDGLVTRVEYTHARRHVEYSLTAAGAALRPVMEALAAWAGEYEPPQRGGGSASVRERALDRPLGPVGRRSD